MLWTDSDRTIIAFAVVGNLLLILSLGAFYNVHHPLPNYLTESGFLQVLADDGLQKYQIVTSSVAVLLMLDFLVDVIGTSIQARLHPTTDGSIRQNIDEWVTRFMLVSTLVVYSVVLLFTPNNDYKIVVAYFAQRYRNISLVNTTYFIMMRTFCYGVWVRRGIQFVSLLYTFCAVLSYYLIFAIRTRTSSSSQTLFVLLVLQIMTVMPIIVLFIYHWAIIFKKAFKSDGFALITIPEINFLVYSIPSTSACFALFARSETTYFQLCYATLSNLYFEESCTLVYAVAAALVPARINRYESTRATQLILSTKRNLNSLLDTPLKLVAAELEVLMNSAQVTADQDDRVKRLAFVSLMCQSVIEQIDSIATAGPIGPADRDSSDVSMDDYRQSTMANEGNGPMDRSIPDLRTGQRMYPRLRPKALTVIRLHKSLRQSTANRAKYKPPPAVEGDIDYDTDEDKFGGPGPGQNVFTSVPSSDSPPSHHHLSSHSQHQLSHQLPHDKGQAGHSNHGGEVEWSDEDPLYRFNAPSLSYMSMDSMLSASTVENNQHHRQTLWYGNHHSQHSTLSHQSSRHNSEVSSITVPLPKSTMTNVLRQMTLLNNKYVSHTIHGRGGRVQRGWANNHYTHQSLMEPGMNDAHHVHSAHLIYAIGNDRRQAGLNEGGPRWRDQYEEKSLTPRALNRQGDECASEDSAVLSVNDGESQYGLQHGSQSQSQAQSELESCSSSQELGQHNGREVAMFPSHTPHLLLGRDLMDLLKGGGRKMGARASAHATARASMYGNMSVSVGGVSACDDQTMASINDTMHHVCPEGYEE